jgi:DsbC/DsbD-like thiol-disulfide interchange protein
MGGQKESEMAFRQHVEDLGVGVLQDVGQRGRTALAARRAHAVLRDAAQPGVQAAAAVEGGEPLQRDEERVLHHVLGRGAVAAHAPVHELVQRVHVPPEQRRRGLLVAGEHPVAQVLVVAVRETRHASSGMPGWWRAPLLVPRRPVILRAAHRRAVRISPWLARGRQGYHRSPLATWKAALPPVPRPMTPRAVWLSLLLPSLLAPAAPAQVAKGLAGTAAQPAPVRARLAAPGAALIAGGPNIVGVVLDLSEGWHVYAPCLNDSGMPVQIEPELPAGWSSQAVGWPAPKRSIGPGGVLDHVYEGQVLLAFEVRVPPEAAGTRTVLRAQVSWMACRSVCILGEATVSLELPAVAGPGEVRPSADAALFEQTRARAPRPLPEPAGPLAVGWAEGALELRAPGAAALTFYPDAEGPDFADLLREAATDGERLVLHLRDGPHAASAVRGVVEVRWPGARPADVFRIDVPLPVPSPPGGAPRAPASQEIDDAR